MATVRGFALKAARPPVGRAAGPPRSRELHRCKAPAERSRSPVPPTLTYGKDGVDIQNFALRVDSGRLSLSGRAGSTLDLRATATALPLAALDLVSPGLGASGTAEGDATIRGTPSDPSGDWRIKLKQVSLPQTRSNALPPLDIAGSGRLAGGRTSVDIAANAGGPIRSASPARRRC